MATVREIIKEYEGQYQHIEVNAYTGKVHRIHTDFITSVDEEYHEEVYMDKNVLAVHLMDEEEYNRTILANASVYFDDMYESGDKILVIMLDEYWNENEKI